MPRSTSRSNAVSGFSEAVARKLLGGLFMFACLGLAVGAYAFWSYVAREHRRLDPWKAPLIWIGDATALVWFLYYFIEHFLFRKRFTCKAATRWWTAGLFSLLAGLSCDLAVTLWHMHDEMTAYAAAEETEGQVTAMKVRRFGKSLTKYDMTCRFADKAGVQYTAFLSVRKEKGRWSPPVPPDVQALLNAGTTPFTMGVAYDPSLPDRNWVRGAGWDDGERLHYLSLLPLFFQAITLPIFLGGVRQSVKQHGIMPWWHDLHRVFPLFIEVTCILLFGTVELFVRARWDF